jgi:hypothetical protein
MLSILALMAALTADPPLAATITAGPPAQVQLRNTGPQPVNAWAFAISSRNPDGGTHNVVHSADAYLTEVTGDLPGAVPHLRAVMPGETRAIPIDPPPADATVGVLAVVFADDTALGDETIVRSFFAQRVVERDQLKEVVEAFNAALQDGHGAAKLEELGRRLAAGEAGGAMPQRTARDAVDTWRQRAAGGASAEDIEQSMRTYVAFVTRQYEAAVKHAQRKMG